MSSSDYVARGVWRLLKELYLNSANKQCSDKFAIANESANRTILKQFAISQAGTSKPF